ncbi:hypothetical protein ACE1CD_01155 [Aerosakkonema sp. BLCC-F183]|uniref:hypothetical protein n=1 Tax=Aerosakkonema sp. BLCC-F183 TaxID=3342834 RepID=UPI0035B78C43
MPVNADKPHLWKSDIAQSVDFYNNWFIQFAPQAYRDTRLVTTQQVGIDFISFIPLLVSSVLLWQRTNTLDFPTLSFHTERFS